MEKSSSREFFERTGMVNCLENETAFCIAQCPFHFDVPEFMNKIRRGSFNSAFKEYKNAVGFPRIALELCDERCNKVCPRKDKDAPLQLKSLEKAVLKYAKNTDPAEFNLPPKDKKIAIIGAGLCGLACALRLCEKKYKVDIFEKTDKIGGHLWEIMEPAIFLEDFEKQFMFEKYQLNLNIEIKSLDAIIDKYDAVFIATGKDGFIAEGKGIFSGGALLRMADLGALVNGLETAKQIEAYLKTGVMGKKTGIYCTRMPLPDLEDVEFCVPKMDDPQGFNEQEAKAEASRCLRCQCNACQKHCEVLSYYKKSPHNAMEEVWATTELKGVLSDNMAVATKMIASCSQCGICSEKCPERIDFKDIMLEARRTLHKKGFLPWAFNDFFLRDMAHANNGAEITIDPCPALKPKYIYFPGCQLGASDPRYVTDSYRLLLEHHPDTVLICRCCGAPAVWAGDEELQKQAFDQFAKQWEEYDRPEVVFACPTCKKMFDEYLPDIKGVFLYQLLEELDIKISCPKNGKAASVFDPCNSREETGAQLSVRKLAKNAGYILTPLKNEGKTAQCCGFGGNIRVVNPQIANGMAEKRIAQSKDMYITYCTNCRDIFADYGKEAIHILDAVLGINGEERPAPSITQRRRNREILKAALLKEYCGKEDNMNGEEKPTVIISDQLKKSLNKKLILEDNIIEVIDYCQNTGNKVRNLETDTYSGYKKIGYVTFWVEYRCTNKGIELVDAYSHRISIEG